ncbi:MAG: RNA polymerase factor sigma-54 [Hydrogenophilales bacterium CG_4_9_14_3_um_filter_63_34]|nr:MAG: RNA polymerase factor sigma-54 [Hydrogenophilales bacterium CG_4_10_14_3_um_filter_63_21]PJB05598.1 MAG: RNA polymerase factor sigma-54 [Hydrogenophilales bacterium CG_4_9_14_3_um_filter_63_34]
MKQSLQLKLHQQLTLTPQLQQSIRLLQLSTLELGQEISQMLQDNPLLERLDGEDSFDGPSGDTPADETARQERDDVYEEMAWGDRAVGPAPDEDEDEHGFQQAESTNLRQHLAEQLGLTALTHRDSQLVAFLIEALGDDGYLTASLEELAELLPAELEVDPVELHTALGLLQSFDPVGVGARDLGECLWLQLNAFPKNTPHLEAAKTLVREHLTLLADREYGKLKKLLELDDHDFMQLRQLITSLEPRPGAVYTQTDTRYVVPDVFVKKVKGLWVVNLNPSAMPKLRINEMYAGILRNNREGGASLSTQLQEARWLIKNVQQRFETILKVSQAIVDRQRMFFEHGAVAMRPLTLKEIADTVELHESTISRVTTQKFMMTPRGLFEFKYFFGSSLATEEGGAASSTAMRALLKQFIDAENRANPLSDNALSELLGKQGFVVARRTVAKYRELLNIPPANQRKSM